MIIDRKGRLFGLINIIDFMVILFVLSITPMFYFGFRLTKAPKTTTTVLVDYKKKYDDEVAQKEQIFKKHPRMRKYFY